MEEQFYSVWPFLVSRISKQSLMRFSVALFALSLLLRGLCFAFGAGRIVNIYFVTFTRMDGLAVGSWIAAYKRHRAITIGQCGKAALVAALSFVVCIAYSQCKHESVRDDIASIFVYSAVAVIFGCTVIFVTNQGCKLLRSPILLIYGRYSYLIYLIHEPVIILVKHWINPNFLGHVMGSLFISQLCFSVIIMGIITAAGGISWNFLERKLISLNRYFPAGSDRGEAKQPNGEHSADIGILEYRKPPESLAQS